MSFEFVRADLEYLQIDDTLGITDYPFTMACWFNIATSGVNALLGLYDYSGSVPRQLIVVRGSGLLGAFSDGAVATGTSTISTDVWYFCTGVFVSDASRKIYLNGVEEGSDTTSVAYNALIDKASLGSILRLAGADPGTILDGKLEAPVIYNRALSPEEIQEIMYKPYSIANGLIYAPDLLSSFSTVADIKDLSGNGNVIDSGTVPSLSGDEPPIWFDDEEEEG